MSCEHGRGFGEAEKYQSPLKQELGRRQEIQRLLAEHREYLSPVTEKNLLAVIKQAYGAPAETVIITDIDETISNCTRRHYDICNRYFKRLKKRPEGRQVPNLPLPSYEKMLELGGSHDAYGKFGPRYYRLNAQARANPNFNNNLPLVDKNLLQYFRAIHARFPFVGALSTRDEAVQAVSEENLQRDLHLAELKLQLPVITRPPTTPLSETSNWKFTLLQTIAATARKRLIMLDDQRELINLITTRDNPLVKGVLMKGPRTPLQVKGETLTAVYWEQLLDHLGQFERRRGTSGRS